MKTSCRLNCNLVKNLKVENKTEELFLLVHRNKESLYVRAALDALCIIELNKEETSHASQFSTPFKLKIPVPQKGITKMVSAEADLTEMAE